MVDEQLLCTYSDFLSITEQRCGPAGAINCGSELQFPLKAPLDRPHSANTHPRGPALHCGVLKGVHLLPFSPHGDLDPLHPKRHTGLKRPFGLQSEGSRSFRRIELV